MFVINADSTNSGYANTSINGVYDPPMDGSTYTMYSSGHFDLCNTAVRCNQGTDHSYQQLTICPNGNCIWNYNYGWNGCCENASSVLDYAKAYCISQEIYFPKNLEMNGSCCQFWTSSFFQIYTYFCNYVCDTVRCCNLHFDARLINRYVSNKTFGEGVCIGKTISGYMNATVYGWGEINICTANPVYSKLSFLGDGIPYYVDMGLLHKNGTTTSIYCCLFKTGYRTCDCWLKQYNYYCGYGTCYDRYQTFCPFVEVIGGIKSTQGALSQDGDRIYIDFGYNETNTYLWLKCCCTAPSGNVFYGNVCGVVKLYGSGADNFIREFSGVCCSQYLSGCQNNMYAYWPLTCSCESARFKGIQFSLE